MDKGKRGAPAPHGAVTDDHAVECAVGVHVLSASRGQWDKSGLFTQLTCTADSLKRQLQQQVALRVSSLLTTRPSIRRH